MRRFVLGVTGVIFFLSRCGVQLSVNAVMVSDAAVLGGATTAAVS